MITRKQKEQMLLEIAEEMKRAELLIVTDYRGLNVKSISALRGRLKSEQCRFRITKNTLNRLACRRAGVADLEPLFEGPTAIAYTSADPVAAAKVFMEFSRENEALAVKGGMLSGRMLDPAQIKTLGEIPPREVLLSMVVGGFQAPITGLAVALKGTIGKLVYAVDAVRRQQESA